ncbi:MAG: hypothetical protein JNM24_17380 [Bdellovibrionaceae bacterium]|nr:hypothetical protein [Pseudobdellovibrionaceae bacterium]
MHPLFPINPDTYTVSIYIFQQVSAIITSLVALVFTIRTVMLLTKMAPPTEYGDLLISVATYFIMTQLTPYLIDVSFKTIAFLAQELASLPSQELESEIMRELSKLFENSLVVRLIPELAALSVFWLVQSIFTILISFSIALGPIFIFISSMIGSTDGLRTYFSNLMALSIWPITWCLIGTLGTHVLKASQSGILFKIIFYIVLLVFQLLSPIFTYSIIKSASTSSSFSALYGVIRRFL